MTTDSQSAGTTMYRQINVREPFYRYADWSDAVAHTGPETPDLIQNFDRARGWESDDEVSEDYQRRVLTTPEVAEGLEVALAEIDADTA